MKHLKRETDILNFALIISVISLTTSLLVRAPFGFFVALRLTVFGTLLLGVVRWFSIRKNSHLPMFFLAVLYNPVFKVSFGSRIWRTVDSLVALYFVTLLLLTFIRRARYSKERSKTRPVDLE